MHRASQSVVWRKLEAWKSRPEGCLAAPLLKARQFAQFLSLHSTIFCRFRFSVTWCSALEWGPCSPLENAVLRMGFKVRPLLALNWEWLRDHQAKGSEHFACINHMDAKFCMCIEPS